MVDLIMTCRPVMLTINWSFSKSRPWDSHLLDIIRLLPLHVLDLIRHLSVRAGREGPVCGVNLTQPGAAAAYIQSVSGLNTLVKVKRLHLTL